MLPIVLVLFVATSALAAPGISLSYDSINNVAPPKGSGGGAKIGRALEIIDLGETSVYFATAVESVRDLGSLGDPISQGLALSQVVAAIGSVVNGNAGDACAAANLIDAVVSNRGSAGALANFIRSLIANIDDLVVISNNPYALKFSTRSTGNCPGGGRSFAFEQAWDRILSNTSGPQSGLVNEQYCAAKRLYNAMSRINNNSAAVLTAVSLPEVNRILSRPAVLSALDRFVGALGSANAGAAAGALKNALRNSL